MHKNREEGKGRRKSLATLKIPSYIQNKILKKNHHDKILFTAVCFFHTRAQQSCIQEPLQVVHLLGFNCHVPKG